MIQLNKFEELIEDAVIYSKPFIFKNYSISDDDFEDARQNAMLKSWKYLKSFKGKSCFNTWFFKILKNEVLSIIELNKKRRDRFIMSIHDIISFDDKEMLLEKNLKEENSEAKTPLYLLSEKERQLNHRKLLEYAYSRMDKKYSDVLKLIVCGDMNYNKIAKKLHIPVGTVMSRVFTAKVLTKHILKDRIKIFL